jgi:signal transduction histidine kinase
MQHAEQMTELAGTERRRVEVVVKTLTALSNHGESLSEVAHDARNMVSALGLYCDLLGEPGVLATSYSHYGSELKLVAAASRRLMEKLASLDALCSPEASSASRDPKFSKNEIVDGQHENVRHWNPVPSVSIDNLAEELLANRSLLSALAGSSIALTIDVQGGAQPVRLNSEDLTRILVNLVKNASEAMSAVGRIHLSLWESTGEPENAPWLTLNVEDNGPGISESTQEKIFRPGHSTRLNADFTIDSRNWPSARRGLGLSITRSIVEAAGGMIHAANRDPVGACFQIELPVRTK